MESMFVMIWAWFHAEFRVWRNQLDERCGFFVSPNAKGDNGTCFVVAICLATGMAFADVMARVRAIEPNACTKEKPGVSNFGVQYTMLEIFDLDAQIPESYLGYGEFFDSHQTGTYLVVCQFEDIGHVTLVHEGKEYGTTSNFGAYVKFYYQLA